MRIVGGALKGRTLLGFKGEKIRPTSDNARESLFNILGDISGAEFLDLFSGTGAVGIEAFSRGAIVSFNDFDRESAALTRANIQRTGAKGTVTQSDALSFIRAARNKYDLIFLDPPYKSPIASELLNSVSDVLKDDGIVIFENEEVFTGFAEGLVLTDVRRYGRAVLCFFKRKKSGFAVYAGTFDPVTIGHEKSVAATARAFGKTFVVLGDNPEKAPLFSAEERAEMLAATFAGEEFGIIKFSDFADENAYAEYVKNAGAAYYVRGIRDARDFEYEKKAERRNAAVYPFITTVYVFCDKEDMGISSTKIRNALKKGKDVSAFIPERAREVFARIMRKKSGKI